MTLGNDRQNLRITDTRPNLYPLEYWTTALLQVLTTGHVLNFGIVLAEVYRALRLQGAYSTRGRNLGTFCKPPSQ